MPSTHLLIADAEFPAEQGDPCRLIHDLRHHEAGVNPFLPVIMVRFQPTQELTVRVVDSGADDLLVMPLSGSQLIERITVLVDARKPFVVTSDYIGPDRRKKSRTSEADGIPTIEVPNPLRVKATGEKSEDDPQQFIDQTIQRINLEKIQRHAVQIGVLVALLLPYYEGARPRDAVLGQTLARLLYVAEDISRRVIGTSYDHVSDLCSSMVSVASELSANPLAPSRKTLELLTPLSQAIQAAFAVKENVAEIAKRISETVDARAIARLRPDGSGSTGDNRSSD